MKHKQLVYLEWEDVTSSGPAWYTEDEKDTWCDNAQKGFIVHNTGFVLAETKDYIVLCSHYHPETEIVPEQYGHLQKILKSLIRKRKNLTTT